MNGGWPSRRMLDPNDRMLILPPDTIIGELNPRWALGFEEPHRKPDYYSRTFVFSNVSKERPVSISFRRPVNELFGGGFQLSEPNVITVDDVSCTTCSVSLPKNNIQELAKLLNLQAAVLIRWQYRRDVPFLPLRADPGINPGPGEFQPSLEAHCENVACTKLTLSRLGVMWGGKAIH
jgi:hypothetical protein